MQNTFTLKTYSLIAWFSCLGLWKIGNKWPFFFHIWQIFEANEVTKQAENSCALLQFMMRTTNPYKSLAESLIRDVVLARPSLFLDLVDNWHKRADVYKPTHAWTRAHALYYLLLLQTACTMTSIILEDDVSFFSLIKWKQLTLSAGFMKKRKNFDWKI